MLDPKSTVRVAERGDLEQVLFWRNDREVRRFMFTQHKITHKEHLAWFEQASQDKTRHMLIFEYDNKPFGFININEIVEGCVANWGFYMSVDSPIGMGAQLGLCALRYGFLELGLNKLCGQVLAYNHKSLRFHLKLGFIQEGILRDQYYDGKNFHDLVCFGILKEEWRKGNGV